MKVSIVCVTARPGGLDCLRTGLAHQEFDHNEFELVLVDALYEYRKDIVTSYFAEKKILCRHIPPRQRVFPTDAVPQARNAAIAKARGELLLWIVDYSVLPPRCLAEHWGVFEYFEKKRSGMAAHRYLFPPKPAYTVPFYAPFQAFTPNQASGITYEYNSSFTASFVTDLETGFYAPYMLSIFENPIESQDDINLLHEDLYFYHADPKLDGLIGGDVSGNFFHAKGESVPRSVSINVNGFDEDYISHCYDDTGFGHMVMHGGHKWILLDQSANIDIVNVRHYMPHLVRRIEDIKALEPLYHSRTNNMEYIKSSNSYSLERMKQMGSWWY